MRCKTIIIRCTKDRNGARRVLSVMRALNDKLMGGDRLTKDLQEGACTDVGGVNGAPVNFRQNLVGG